MGPYAALNTVFIGFFAFAAMLFVLVWSQARRDAVLLVFAIHCAMCAILSASLYGVVAAQTPAEGQRALDMRNELAALTQISVVWLVSLIADLRARWFVWSMTAVFLAAAFVNAAILPLAGSVTGVERIATPWGEQVSILHRESPSRWLAPLYALAISISIFISAEVAEALAFELTIDATQPRHALLSDREFDVLRLIASGQTVGDIAARLALSVKTVSTYRARILQKMRLKNNSELMQYVLTNRLLD